MTRVLLVGKGAPERGGIPSFLGLLLDSRLASDHDLRFLNLAGRSLVGGRLGAGNIARTAVDAVRVWKAARHVDVVHIHSALAPGVTLVRAGTLALAGRVAGARTIVHGHGGRIQLWLTTPRRRRVARLALGAVDTVVAVSAGAAGALAAALPAGSVQLVENGVDVSRFTMVDNGARPGPLRILYVGILTPRKGVLDLLEASDIVEGGGLAHEVLLVGGPPDEGGAAGEDVAVAAGTRDGRVHLTGAKSPAEMPAVYREADVFCLPSWWEAMPLSVLEAMAAGLPVVATDVGDVSRVVEHGVNGLIVPPHNPAALAAALVDLLGDAARRARLGRAGRDTVTTSWNAERTIARIADLYGATTGPDR